MSACGGGPHAEAEKPCPENPILGLYVSWSFLHNALPETSTGNDATSSYSYESPNNPLRQSAQERSVIVPNIWR